MKIPLRKLLTGTIWIVGLSTASASPAASLPGMTVPQTCGIQLKGHNATAEDLDRIAALGIKFVRRGFIWANVEQSPGVYDFSEYDQLISECEQRGLSVLGCMALLNSKVHPHPKEPAGRAAFAKFSAALAARYKGRKIIWEIWNEPNVATFWGKHGKANSDRYADEYTALVKAVLPAMRKADPNCTIIAGSVSGLWKDSYSWMDRCFKNGILHTGIDGWSVHPYTTKNPEGYIAEYARVRQMMADAGAPKNFPLLDSERGYPIGKAEGYAGGDPALSREYQAWHFVRQYLVDLLCNIRLTIWYEWSGDSSGVHGGFSIYGKDNPAPALSACKVMIEELDGYRLERRIPLQSERDFILRFVNEAGGVKLVAWTSPEAGGAPDKTVTHDVSIPVEATGVLDTLELYGQKGTVPVKDGAITLSLSGAPQYVTERTPQPPEPEKTGSKE